jgi:hypothetical protein
VRYLACTARPDRPGSTRRGIGDDEQAGELDPEQEKQFRDVIRQEHATLGRQRKELAEQMAPLEAPKHAPRPADSADLLDARSSGGSTAPSGWMSATADHAKS